MGRAPRFYVIATGSRPTVRPLQRLDDTAERDTIVERVWFSDHVLASLRWFRFVRFTAWLAVEGNPARELVALDRQRLWKPGPRQRIGFLLFSRASVGDLSL